MPEFTACDVIECGIETCASSPGRFCNHVRTERFGTAYMCAKFFDETGMPARLWDDVNGWLARVAECRLEYSKHGAIETTEPNSGVLT